MEKKQVAIGDPVSVGGATIIPVTQTWSHSWQDQQRSTFFGLKKPLYVLVLSAELPVRAFGIDGIEIDVKAIRDEYPELQPALSRITGK